MSAAIYSYNFFPTIQSNDQIKLMEAAVAKIAAFISLLGNDARLLTDGEVIESHELFNRLTSKKTIIGEDDSEKKIDVLIVRLEKETSLERARSMQKNFI
ncbi:MAG: hypothetical protein PF551_02760 [Candidatus Marinimicrobia bacterium]|nr:hypothetical protein [Candidatus Neomarinimicrobiota bacterium]